MKSASGPTSLGVVYDDRRWAPVSSLQGLARRGQENLRKLKSARLLSPDKHNF